MEHAIEGCQVYGRTTKSLLKLSVTVVVLVASALGIAFAADWDDASGERAPTRYSPTSLAVVESGICASCHGVNGVSSTDAIPNLAGQGHAYLVKQIKAFREGTRQNAVMEAMTKPLSDQDIEDLATYYSTQKGIAASGIGLTEGEVAAGHGKSGFCANCHGVAGVSHVDAVPNLADQSYSYLVQQIKAFRDDTRQDSVMGTMAKPLSDQDIEDLAAYYSAQNNTVSPKDSSTTAAFAASTVQQSSVPASLSSPHSTMFNEYCIKCHNGTVNAGGLILFGADVENVGNNAELWEKVDQKLRTNSMPPVGMPRPDQAQVKSITGYLEAKLDAAAAADPNPGRPAAVHRLNRTEYNNAIRDLLALDISGEALLPTDEAGAGFDNNGDILSVSELLMERYLIAARQISRTAIGDPTLRPVVTTFSAPTNSLQRERESEDLPFGSRGGMAIKYNFPLDGEYTVRIRLLRTKGIEGPRIMGLGEPRQLDVRLDGARVKLFKFGGEHDPRRPDEVEASLEVRFPVKAGTREVGVTFMDEGLAPEGMQRPLLASIQLKGWGPRDDSRRPPGVESVSIGGPYDAHGAELTPSRRKIFVCNPKEAKDEEPCAKQILSGLARHAYRRPVTASDVDFLLKYYRAGHDAQKNGNAFEEGVRAALEMILVSPDFLFRIEQAPPDATHGIYRISDFELASRLSFFLWSSIPDDEMLDLAAAGKLSKPSVLQNQVQRMLADSRSDALISNFVGQWLGLRSVKDHDPDVFGFPQFDDDLREAFEKECDLFFASMLRENHSVVDLLNADYTYVNERLARFYGIPDIYGSRFRRVTLKDENRWGILGKGSILMVTSLPNRTSPTLRGKWILENVMGAPPPPPPPNVPAFPEDKNSDLMRLTVRQKMEEHRANPVCASCHARMDPLGFAFDNFDAIGKWHDVAVTPVFASPELPILTNPIDASGALPDGTPFQGPSELREILLRNPENFVYVVAERLLTYALGRGVDYYDQPALRKIVRNSAHSDYRWSDLILEIVKSMPFQMRAPAPVKPQLEASAMTNPEAKLH